MLMLSKKVEYGLIAMLHMASVRSDALSSTKEISEQYQIPAELLGKVLQALAKAGLVESSQGARGGYRLGRSIKSITLSQVIEALEGPVHLVRCHEDPGACDQYGTCTIRGPVRQVHEMLEQFLRSVSLDQFRQPDPNQWVPVEIHTEER